MKAWGRAEAGAWAGLPLRAHTLLEGVPLHDVWYVDLPGGSAPCTLADVRSLMSAKRLTEVNAAVRALFALRGFLGRIFGWDAAELTARPAPASEHSFLHRLDEDDRGRSLEPPGSADGPFTILYVHETEAASEIRNATVHAFSVYALEPSAGGHRLYWAIYVAPVGGITRLYMALIDPFRHFLIYPAILRHVHRAWRAAHPG